MKSVSWNVKVHDSEGSSPYSHAETRVESLELSNWRKRRPGQSPAVPIGDELYPPRLSRTVLNCPGRYQGDAQRILPIPPDAGLFHASSSIPYTDARERPKTSFHE